MSVAIITWPGSTGIDDPPGLTAVTLRPSGKPPAIASSVANGVPSFTSKFPGRRTSPDTEKILVPPLLVRPRLRKASPPLRMIHGTAANVSVLLIVVGLPYTPYDAGHRGLQGGGPSRPLPTSQD